MAARAAGVQIHDAVALESQELVRVAAHHYGDMILPRELMERELAALELQWDQPQRRAMKEDELRGALAAPFQILLQKLHLIVAQVLRPAVVQDREVRLLVVEAVERRAAGVFLVQFLRRLGSGVVFFPRRK